MALYQIKSRSYVGCVKGSSYAAHRPAPTPVTFGPSPLPIFGAWSHPHTLWRLLRFLRLSSRACSAAAMRDMPPVVLDGAHHDDATQESRACCALCNVKEFLIAITLFLILVDLFDVYGNLIRVTGTELLPFWGNHTDLYYTQVPELNFYDMIISVFDLACVVVLSLSGAPPPALSPTGLSRCAPAR